ncbi:hypothetical protein SAMN05519103_00768 [Rhizobiales bacterium GAS113]|jgi:hypothetical protein|nr:hypothetical protein SAMN05519103_00768 [Rhizobiales bacterium GAS113]SEC58188.1 hypothetical protein SAMN05519104_1654 [Rhizobiales bacterium GAS188]
MSENGIELPSDKALAAKELAAKELTAKALDARSQETTRRLEMGRIGAFLGGRDNAVIYLAWFVIIGASAGATILAILDPALRPDMEKALVGLMISALGFMFGSSGRRERE